MTMATMLASPAVDALGQALLHFLWQGAVAALLLAVVRVFVPRRAAGARYAAACLALLAMPVAVVATIAGKLPAASRAIAASAAPAMESSGEVAPAWTAGSAVAAAREAVPIGLQVWVVGIWTLGVLALAAYTAAGWVRVQRLKYHGTEHAGPYLIQTLAPLMERMGVRRAVRICTSAVAEVPAAIGWLRPVIVMPAATLAGLSPAQLEAIVAHELAHIRRHDYLVNLLQTAIETLLFYHPAVWWVSREIRREREHCCDDVAARVCGDVAVYAGALAELEGLRHPFPELAMGASGGDLAGRIRRLLRPEAVGDRVPRSLGAMAAAAVVVSLLAVPMLTPAEAAPQAPAQEPAAEPARVEPERPVVVRADVPVDLDELEEALERTRPSLVDASEQLAEAREFMAQAARDGRFYQIQVGAPREPSSESVDMLIQLYDSNPDVDMKRTILRYLGESDTEKARAKLVSVFESATDMDVRRTAMRYIAEQDESFAALNRMYESQSDPDLKRTALRYLAESDDPQAAAKILEIARTSTDLDLRRTALRYVAESDDSYDTLAPLFDAEMDLDMKRTILRYLAESDDPRVAQKLFTIAQSDADPDLRRTAVKYIAER